MSFLPNGVGSFEAGSVATLMLLGVSPEAALTATMLLRGLWLPLVPGFLLTRRDLAWWGEQLSEEAAQETRKGS